MVRGGRSWWTGAPTVVATSECLPSAPMTRRAASVTGWPPLERPRMPLTRPASSVSSSTINCSRTSAPAAQPAPPAGQLLDGADELGEHVVPPDEPGVPGVVHSP
jgi:hypothetical protein